MAKKTKKKAKSANKNNIFLILIFVCVVILIIQVVVIVNHRPKVTIGTVEIVTESNSVAVSGYNTVSCFRKNVKTFEIPSVKEISLNNIPFMMQSKSQLFEDLADTPEVDEKTYLPTSSGVKISGTHISEQIYNFYDIDGNRLSAANELQIPIEQLTEDGGTQEVVVELVIKWGKEGNYEEYNYYFKCIVE